MEDKTILGLFSLGCLTALQLFAWYSGHNGVVFATTSGIFGLIAGSLFNIKQSIKEFVTK